MYVCTYTIKLLLLIVVVFMDEAGLPEEQHESLKVQMQSK